MSSAKFSFPLNPAQKKAVETIEGPVMVIAGPGTGKTQTLTARIAYILEHTDTPPNGILALTFTDAAAREMRERLARAIGPTAYYVNIQTFHAFCSNAIQANPDVFPSLGELEPLSDLERANLFRFLIDASNGYSAVRPHGAPYLYLRDIVSAIADLKREGIDPAEFKKLLTKQKKSSKTPERYLQRNLELAKIYSAYNQELRHRNRYDFEDMIVFVSDAFKKNPDFLLSYQEKFLYILVDEFQDTNAAQNELLLLLAGYWGPKANLFVVGDDDQSIFRFQGASVENILGFTQKFSGAEIVVLKENYRSGQIILDAARGLISHNRLSLTAALPQIEKRLHSNSTAAPAPIQVARFSSGISEVFFAAKKIEELIKSGIPPQEIAVVFRHRADAADVAEMLSRLDIPCRIEGGQDVLNQPVIEKLLLIMQAVAGVRTGQEGVDLFTLINQPFFDCDYVDTLKLSRFAADNKIKLWDALGKSGVASLTRIYQLLAQLQQDDADGPFTLFFEKLINKTGFLDWCLKSPDAIEKLNSVNSLFAEIKRLNSADHNLRLRPFLDTVELMRQQKVPINEQELDLQPDAVALLTAHKAKGREFSCVFIIRAIDGKWGNNAVRELIKLPEGILANTDLSLKEKNEDERRLFYVALTRAKNKIFITSAKTYVNGAQTREAVETMFLAEIPPKYLQIISVAGYEHGVREILKTLLRPVRPAEASAEEEKFLRSVVAVMKLSPTALNTYLTCPYKFKLNNLLRTPRAKAAPMSFGSAIHQALEEFFKKYKLTGRLPAADFLRRSFSLALEREILPPAEADRLLVRGQRVLTEYVEYYKDELIPPRDIERFFGYGFSKVILGTVPLGGKIDKIEPIGSKSLAAGVARAGSPPSASSESANDAARRGEASGEARVGWGAAKRQDHEGGVRKNKFVRVIDYKTGRPRSRRDIEGKTAQSSGDYKRQLVFYKLLADLDQSFNAVVTEAELDFVEPDRQTGKLKKERFAITVDEVEELKSVIKRVWADITALKFPRTTEVQRHCLRCEWKLHCWPDGLPTQPEQLPLI